MMKIKYFSTISMIRQCSSSCPDKAVKQCLCSGQFFCIKHCGEHVVQRGNHNFVDLTLELNPDQRSQLTDELSSRFHIIYQCKATIIAQSSDLVKKIKELSAKALKNLSNLELGYKKFIETKEYSETQMEELNGILKSEMQLKLNSHTLLINSIEKYFEQEFFVTVLFSKMQGFFKTHSDKIECITASKAQKTIFSGGRDCSIKVWNTSINSISYILEGHTSIVMSLSLSKDDSYLVSGSEDKTVRVWCLSDRKEFFMLKGHAKTVLCVSISPNNLWIASGSEDNSVCVWSFNERRLHAKLTQHTDWVNVLAFTESCLFSGSSDNTLIQWGLNSFSQSSVFKLVSSVLCFDISEGSEQVVNGLGNGKIELWENGNRLEEFSGHTDSVRGVKFTSKNKRIISASDDKTVRVWCIEQKSQLSCFDNHKDWVTCLTTLSDDLFVSGSYDYSMMIWDTSSLTLHSTIPFIKVTFSSIVFEENRLFYRFENGIKIWNFDKNCIESEFQGPFRLFICMASSLDFLVSGCKDGSVLVWSVHTGSQAIVFKGHTDIVYAVAICGDTVASGSDDKTVRLWSIKENKESGVLNGHSAWVRSVAFTSNAEIVVSGSRDTTVRVWSVKKMQALFVLNGHTDLIGKVEISKDDKVVFTASAGEGRVRVWNIETGDMMGCLERVEEGEEWVLKYPEVRRLVEKYLSY
jgi:WD40 repeat protein